jgi:hypothetical protein
LLGRVTYDIFAPVWPQFEGELADNYDGGIVPDPEGIITGGQGNKTARTVAIQAGEEINARALKRVFEQIIANNRAGGWRKLKAQA